MRERDRSHSRVLRAGLERDQGVAVNELLTAYLRTLHVLRGGRLSPADAMNHLIDMLSAAQSATTAVGKLMGLGTHAPRSSEAGTAKTNGGQAHA